jgi:hypothetical protein
VLCGPLFSVLFLLAIALFFWPLYCPFGHCIVLLAIVLFLKNNTMAKITIQWPKEQYNDQKNNTMTKRTIQWPKEQYNGIVILVIVLFFWPLYCYFGHCIVLLAIAFQKNNTMTKRTIQWPK